MSLLASDSAEHWPTKSASLPSDTVILVWWVPVLLAGVYVTLTPYTDALASLRLYDTKRLIQIGLLLTSAVLVAGVPRLRSGWLHVFCALPRTGRAGLSAVLALGLTSALVAPVPRYALLEVAHYVLLFVFGLGLASTCRSMPHRYVQVLTGALVLSAGLYVLFVAKGYAAHLTKGSFEPLWPAGEIGYGNRRFFNHVQAWSLSLLIVPALIPSLQCQKGLRTGVFLVTACWWMLLFASNGRGILIAMFIALVGVTLLFRKKALPWLRWQLATGTVGGLLYGVFFQMIATDPSSLVKRTSHTMHQIKKNGEIGRLVNWRAALEAAWQEPWLGLGPMHAAYHPNELWATTHNAAIQFLVEWGASAAVLLVGLSLWGLWAWCRQSRQNLASGTGSEHAWVHAARVPLTGAIFAAGANAMVSGTIVTPASQVTMTLVFGGLLGLHLSKHKPPAPAFIPNEGGQWGLVVFLAVTAGLFVWAIVPDMLLLNVRNAEWIFAQETLWLVPRYWGQGYFGL